MANRISKARFSRTIYQGIEAADGCGSVGQRKRISMQRQLRITLTTASFAGTLLLAGAAARADVDLYQYFLVGDSFSWSKHYNINDTGEDVVETTWSQGGTTIVPTFDSSLGTITHTPNAHLAGSGNGHEYLWGELGLHGWSPEDFPVFEWGLGTWPGNPPAFGVSYHRDYAQNPDSFDLPMGPNPSFPVVPTPFSVDSAQNTINPGDPIQFKSYVQIAAKLVTNPDYDNVLDSIGNLFWQGAVSIHYIYNPNPDTEVQSTGGTSFFDGGNWRGSVPNGTDAIARFGAATSPRALALDTGSATLGMFVVDGASSYTLAGPFALNLNSASTANVQVTGGNHVVSAPVNVLSNTVLAANNATDSLTMSGTLTMSNGVVVSKFGHGTLTLSGAQSHGTNTSLSVCDGTLDLQSNLGSASARNVALTVEGFSSVANVSAAQDLRSLGIRYGGSVKLTSGRDKAVVTNALEVDSFSKLDVNDNGVVIDYSSASPLSDVKTSIGSAFNSANWDGNGITTSLGDRANHAVGYGENSVVGRSQFFGQSVDSTSVLVKYTYYGDANLDGSVDLTDFAIMNANFNGTGKVWTQGDFNYDGVVDSTDQAFLSANFNSSGLSDDAGGGGGAGAPVPEPIGAPVLMLLGLTASKRYRHNRFR